MFIFWGSGGGQRLLGTLPERACAVCDRSSTFSAVVNYRYAHIWYLFSWLTSREYLAVCDHCNNGFPMEKAQAKKLFPSDPVPFIRKSGWKIFAGLVAVLVVLGVFSAHQEGNRLAELMEHPQVNDLYLVNFLEVANSGFTADNASPAAKSPKAAYGAMKLTGIQGDTLTFVTSTKATSKKSALRDMLRQRGAGVEYDETDPLIMSKTDLQALRNKSAIFDIQR